MGVYGNIHGAFNGLGKPSIKLEFEDNEALLDFQRRMQEGGGNPDGDSPDGGGNFTQGEQVLDRLSRIATGRPYLKATPGGEMTSNKEPVVWNEEKGEFEPLNGYGDKYIVTDLRQRAKKEPGEVKSLTKFQFSKFKNAPELFEPVVSVSPSLFSVYPVFKGVNNDIVYFGKEFSDDYNADFILKDYVVNKSEGLVTLNFARYKAYGTDGVSIVSVWSFSISCPVCNIITAYGSKIEAYFGLIEFAEGLIAVLKNAQSKLRSNSKDYKTLQHQIERWQNAANQYADGLAAPGDVYLVTDTRKKPRKELDNVTALKKYDIRPLNSGELAKMQTDDPLLYEQIKSDITGGNAVKFEPKAEPAATAPQKKDDEVKVLLEFQDGKYRASIGFFQPETKTKDGGWTGYDTSYTSAEVDPSKLRNLKPSSHWRWDITHEAFVPKDYYVQLKKDAIKNHIEFLQRSAERDAQNAAKTKSEKDKKWYQRQAAKEIRKIKYLKEYYSEFADNLGRTAPAVLYNNLDILDFRGMQPTYKPLSSYDAFFKPATNRNSLKGWGLDDTKKLIADICRNHYKECAAIAKHLKADTKLQSAFNLWHWLHHNIRYEYDREGREEVRTPARTWQDRHRGVDCDCLSVFVWCVLKCMGYNPAFELAAFRNKPAYSHIYINLDGIVIDRVWYVFNSRPPFITKTELFKVGMLDNLGQLF